MKMDFSKLKNCMDEIVEKYNTPGVDCIVYRNHEILYRYFTGLSDVESNKKMNGNELYLIFSMTKMLTCTAALQLFEQNKFSMEDCLSKYMPEFKKMKLSDRDFDTNEVRKITTGEVIGGSSNYSYNGYAQNPITIKDLFTMGAGFDYVLDDDGITEALKEGKNSTRDLVGAMSGKVLGFEPGTRFRYSLCHDVLGALIEIWSGQNLGEYLKKNIFEPLNMKNTFFGVTKDEALLKRMAALYTHSKDKQLKRLPLECVYNLSENYQSGGAGLTSCTEDYAVFLDSLACGGVGKTGERILKSETVCFMGTNQLSGKQCDDFYKARPGYGYGLGVRTHIDRSASGSKSPIGEFGWDGAAGAFSLVDTKNKLSLTYFQHNLSWDIKIQSNLRNALYECV